MTRLLGNGSGLDSADEPSQQQMLNQAKRVLDDIAFVGFTESYERSLYQLQRQFGWPVEPVAHLNAAPSWPLCENNKFLHWLEDMTSFDDQLYEYAFRQHNERFA